MAVDENVVNTKNALLEAIRDQLTKFDQGPDELLVLAESFAFVTGKVSSAGRSSG